MDREDPEYLRSKILNVFSKDNYCNFLFKRKGIYHGKNNKTPLVHLFAESR